MRETENLNKTNNTTNQNLGVNSKNSGIKEPIIIDFPVKGSKLNSRLNTQLGSNGLPPPE